MRFAPGLLSLLPLLLFLLPLLVLGLLLMPCSFCAGCTGRFCGGRFCCAFARNCAKLGAARATQIPSAATHFPICSLLLMAPYICCDAVESLASSSSEAACDKSPSGAKLEITS